MSSPCDRIGHMPCMQQEGPSCGTTCLAMCLECHGFPAAASLIEPCIHPYGQVDLGEVPAELARYARMMGFSARHYNHGDVEHISTYLQLGCTVTVMLNYNGGMGHIVNVIGVACNAQGAVAGIKFRNPWGYDECIGVGRFIHEWSRMCLTRKNIMGRWLPVFDRAYVVVAQPEQRLPAPSIVNWLHSAPVNLLVSGLNGIGGCYKTVRNGHYISGILQLVGSILKVITGFASYLVGNLIGKNMEFGGQSLAMHGSSRGVAIGGRAIEAVGQSISLVGGLLACLADLATIPLVLLSEQSSRRDSVREHVESADDDRLRRTLARSSDGAKANQIKALLRGYGRVTEADRVAAARIQRLRHVTRA